MDINKVLEYNGSITQLKNKILKRLSLRQLNFNNKIQLAEISVLNNIDNILNNTDNYIACKYCQELFYKGNLQDIDNQLLCQNCIDDNFKYCDDCGDIIYNDDINVLNECDIYCNECFFIAKQAIYKEHKIKSNKLKALLRLCKIKNDYNILLHCEFKIDNYLWDIEDRNGIYRIGSWGANCWYDIGNDIKYLLQAIDYNLGYNRSKLTDISL